jgi:hypothetical protein
MNRRKKAALRGVSALSTPSRQTRAPFSRDIFRTGQRTVRRQAILSGDDFNIANLKIVLICQYYLIAQLWHALHLMLANLVRWQKFNNNSDI